MPQIYSRYGIFSAIFVAIFLTACKEENYPIPNVPVNVTINLDLPAYQALNAPGGYVYTSGGSRGIVVYRNFDEFIALDRHSTYDIDNVCSTVHVDPQNVFELVDTCSGATYSIMSGVVIKGPAKFALRRYNTYWDGAYMLSIYN